MGRFVRYYDPVAGRFLSTDPVLTDNNSGASFNRYTYANNNPYKYIDPDGRDAGSFYGTAPSVQMTSSYSKEAADVVTDFMPLVGTTKSVHEAIKVPSLGNFAMVGAAIIPGGKPAAKMVSGWYKLVFKSGGEYIGKGKLDRMKNSVRRLTKDGKQELESATHTPMASEREALKEESRQIEAAGGAKSQNPDTKLLNEIDSPGTKMRKVDGEK